MSGLSRKKVRPGRARSIRKKKLP